ncbi:MAG: hypothetical protein KZQ93_11645 [Candidatus Thiodiazotropha sp. (ex Monitilora ramsayi)]|nr:hypothetical protein [Candidatus Thiodiazotropha sp. (ex Monitilora ramsayi)]
MNTTEKQEIIDTEHLHLLTLFHYISGGLTLVMSTLFFAQTAIFKFMLSHLVMPQDANNIPPEQFEMIFEGMIWMVGIFATLGFIYGISEILSGRYIKSRKNKLFSILISIPRILLVPYGTILTICTLIVLDRPSVKCLYSRTNNGTRVNEAENEHWG